MGHVKHFFVCEGCGHGTANRGRRCTRCLNTGRGVLRPRPKGAGPPPTEYHVLDGVRQRAGGGWRRVLP